MFTEQVRMTESLNINTLEIFVLDKYEYLS